MKTLRIIPCLLVAASSYLSAQVSAPVPAQPVKPKQNVNLVEKLRKSNALKAEQLKAELAEMRANIQRIKLQRELLSEKQRLQELKDRAARQAELKKYNKAKEELAKKVDEAASKASLAESQADQAKAQFKLQQIEWGRKAAQLKAQIEEFNTKSQRNNYADAKPVYLANPLKDDGTLVISDRRIALDGPIFAETADYITNRIHYYNNKDKKLPIFIVIGDSPGGSVMAGYRIIKAMQGSDAPVHVVVKSFAASMAASITTLAEHSYAYPNAIILHHQISSSYFFTTMNLTQQKEAYQDSQKWWKKLAGPIAKKMGISDEEFIKKMYQHNSNGDWAEFATEAVKLKWVNHIVQRIKETGKVIDPNSIEKKDEDDEDGIFILKETVGADGKPCIYLPRINPLDVYFMYNPDGYYRLRK